MKREHKSNWRALKRQQKSDWHDLKNTQVRDRVGLRREFAKERLGFREKQAGNPKEARDEAKTKLVSEYNARAKDMLASHMDEIGEKHVEFKRDREGLREDHRDERREFIKELRQELDTKFPGRRKSKRRNVQGQVSGLVELKRDFQESRRFTLRRTHKASSAEAILRSCLQRRGWTREWRSGLLTGKQHLSLLEDIRQYGRSWLRHEAEAFFDQYGEEQERGLATRASSAIGRFFDRAKQFIKELVFAGALALKGSDELSANEIASLDNQAKVQHEYLDKFRREVNFNPPSEIADPTSQITISPAPMTSGQFIARAEQYGNSVWQAGVNAGRDTQVRVAVAKEERRILGRPKTEHCHDCPPLAAMGWQPLGSLPAIGDTECGGLCLCHFIFRDKEGAIPFIRLPKQPRKKDIVPPAQPKPAKTDQVQPAIKVPSLEELKKEAKEAGATFSDVEYETFE